VDERSLVVAVLAGWRRKRLKKSNKSGISAPKRFIQTKKPWFMEWHHADRIAYPGDKKNPPAGDFLGGKEGSAAGEPDLGYWRFRSPYTSLALPVKPCYCTIISLTFYGSYAKIALPLIGCPPQPVRGIFYPKCDIR
jgi:hypothetical protein